jgi:hypothetical protein
VDAASNGGDYGGQRRRIWPGLAFVNMLVPRKGEVMTHRILNVTAIAGALSPY